MVSWHHPPFSWAPAPSFRRLLTIPSTQFTQQKLPVLKIVNTTHWLTNEHCFEPVHITEPTRLNLWCATEKWIGGETNDVIHLNSVATSMTSCGCLNNLWNNPHDVLNGELGTPPPLNHFLSCFFAFCEDGAILKLKKWSKTRRGRVPNRSPFCRVLQLIRKAVPVPSTGTVIKVKNIGIYRYNYYDTPSTERFSYVEWTKKQEFKGLLNPRYVKSKFMISDIWCIDSEFWYFTYLSRAWARWWTISTPMGTFATSPGSAVVLYVFWNSFWRKKMNLKNGLLSCIFWSPDVLTFRFQLTCMWRTNGRTHMIFWSSLNLHKSPFGANIKI